MALTIEANDRNSRARAGLLHTAHGDVRTPAFVPLATKATVKGLLPREVAALGYQMILGNTFHLMLSPGSGLIKELGGLHGFMGWDGPIITDSGGFQVFSMGHGTVAQEIKSRGRQASSAHSRGTILSIEEQGVRFRSYIDGRDCFLSPEGSMRVQASLARTSRSCSTSAPPSMSTATTPHARPSAPTGGCSAACPGMRSTDLSSSWCTGSCRVACTRICV